MCDPDTVVVSGRTAEEAIRYSQDLITQWSTHISGCHPSHPKAKNVRESIKEALENALLHGPEPIALLSRFPLPDETTIVIAENRIAKENPERPFCAKLGTTIVMAIVGQENLREVKTTDTYRAHIRFDRRHNAA
jgi:hypothetical protein